MIVLLFVLFVFSFASCIVTFSDWKYYKKVYKSLPNQQWYRNSNQIYNYNHNFLTGYNSKPDSIVWFFGENSFKIEYGIYIHNIFITYLSPYSLYWYIKYKRWFKKNVNPDTLPLYGS